MYLVTRKMSFSSQYGQNIYCFIVLFFLAYITRKSPSAALNTDLSQILCGYYIMLISREILHALLAVADKFPCKYHIVNI